MLGAKVWTFERSKMWTFYIFELLKAHTNEPNISLIRFFLITAKPRLFQQKCLWFKYLQQCDDDKYTESYTDNFELVRWAREE